MHDDSNYKKQAESDYEKFHLLREANSSSKVIRSWAVRTRTALAKDQRILWPSAS